MVTYFTRFFHRHLLVPRLRTILFLLFWAALISGLLIRQDARIFLPVHFVATGILALPLLLFLNQHWWQRRDRASRHPNARYGYVALVAMVGLFASGFALLRWTNVPALRWGHSGAALLLVVDLSWHIAWQLRRRNSSLRTASVDTKNENYRTSPELAEGRAENLSLKNAYRDSSTLSRTTFQQPITYWAGSGLVAALLLWGMSDGLWQAFVTNQAVADVQPAVHRSTTKTTGIATGGSTAPAIIPLQHDSLNSHSLYSAQQCAECHGAISQQWQQSAHAHAATDPYYQVLTAMFIQERGIDAARYCATCHNPIGLISGEIAFGAVAEAGREDAETAHAYDVRKLGVDLAISHQAAEGVTCVMCHLANEVVEEPRNGSMNLVKLFSQLPNERFEKLAMRASSGDHRQAMMPSAIQQAELCGSCHNLETPDGFLLEPTYDEWRASPYAEQGITCQSCHMPLVSGRRVNSGGVTRIASHGGSPGAPSSLAGVADSTTLLAQAATLTATVEAVPDPASALMLTVGVTNSGAGHYFPTGADDLRQVWLEVIAFDQQGEMLWQQGVLDEFGRLPADSVRFGKVLGDANGRPITLHRFWTATQILEDTRLAPLETRTIHISIPQAQPRRDATRVQVRLLYRDVSQPFAEFAFDRPVDELPIFEVAKIILSPKESP